MKKKFAVLGIISLFIIWSSLVFYFTPQGIVDFIGIKNSYILLYVLAIIGGTSILLPFPYYLFTISLGASGLNPFLLGISAGLGTFMGDATSYFLGYKGSELLSNKFSKKIHKIALKKPWFFPIFAFFYSISPFPEDILMVPAGLAKYPFKYLALPVFLGKVIFNTLLAFSGLYGWKLFFG